MCGGVASAVIVQNHSVNERFLGSSQSPNPRVEDVHELDRPLGAGGAEFWESTGRRIARKNLTFSMFAEHIGFCVWVLWTHRRAQPRQRRHQLSLSELFLLTLVPNLVGVAAADPLHVRGAALRWPGVDDGQRRAAVHPDAVARLRRAERLAGAAARHAVLVLLLTAATAGLGGGNFSSSMANISFFYPERKKGLALGLNAAGGNLGVAVAQLVVPLVIIIGVPAAAVKVPHPVHLAYAGLMWLPFIAIAVIGAWLLHGQPHPGQGRHHVVPAGAVHTGTPGSCRSSTSARSARSSGSRSRSRRDQDHVPRVPGRPPVHRHLPGGLGFLGALVGSIVPSARRLARRPGRRARR